MSRVVNQRSLIHDINVVLPATEMRAASYRSWCFRRIDLVLELENFRSFRHGFFLSCSICY
jgi:hypothetical protein